MGPRQHGAATEFWAVVCAQDAREAASECQTIEDACDGHAPEGTRRHNGHGLGGRIVDNRQALHDPPVGRPVPRFGKSGKVVGVQPALTDEDNPVLSTLLRNGKGVVLTLQAEFVAGGTLPGETQDPRSRIKLDGYPTRGQ